MQRVMRLVVGLLRSAGQVATTRSASFLLTLLLGVHVPVDAARSLRETVCIQPGAMALDADTVRQVGKLIAASERHKPVVGVFVSVFVHNESMSAFRDGISAVSVLLEYMDVAEREVRNWPFDLKFFSLSDQPCTPGGVLVELSISFDENPLTTPKQ